MPAREGERLPELAAGDRRSSEGEPAAAGHQSDSQITSRQYPPEASVNLNAPIMAMRRTETFPCWQDSFDWRQVT
jgi:hypothetical protein